MLTLFFAALFLITTYLWIVEMSKNANLRQRLVFWQAQLFKKTYE